ncbi:serine aminopeptidase domain-containing protein [Aquitalea pelogenes]|uniref:serine aminopeptidase domain-containing protein n=1 Tax=Aquitalea pelogenes TaxID=1293573 RepID=UPI003B8476D5
MTNTCTRGKIPVLPSPFHRHVLVPAALWRPSAARRSTALRATTHPPAVAARCWQWSARAFSAPASDLATTRHCQHAFDFVGHGDTGGSLTGSSLAHRVRQAETVLVAGGLHTQPLALLGSSMGAYIAIRLLDDIQCSHLILQVPGAYTPDAFAVPFGPAFSACCASRTAGWIAMPGTGWLVFAAICCWWKQNTMP